MVMLGTDMKVAQTPKDGLKDYTKADPYAEWLEQEGVKVHEEFYFPSLRKSSWGLGSVRVAVAPSSTSPTATCPTTVTSSRSSREASPSRSITCTRERSMWFRAGGATTIWQDEKQKKKF